MSVTEVKTMLNRTKAAILLMSLDSKMPGLSQQLFSSMGESTSKVLLKEISQLGKVPTETIDKVIDEFYMLAISQEVLMGGKSLTNQYLKDSFGIDDADEFFSSKVGLFGFMHQLTDNQIMAYLMKENDQTIALILSVLPDERSAKLLSEFPVHRTAIISNKMITINVPNYSLLWKFHRELETHLLGREGDKIEESQQIFKLSRVLEMMVSDTRKSVMDVISQADQNSAHKINQLIFSFDDLIFMKPKDLQVVLVSIDPLQTLAIALHGVPKELSRKVQDNISEKLLDRFQELITNAGDITDEKVQEAQSEVVLICRKLEQEEKITPLKEIIEIKQKQGVVLSDMNSAQSSNESIGLEEGDFIENEDKDESDSPSIGVNNQSIKQDNDTSVEGPASKKDEDSIKNKEGETEHNE